MNKLVSVDPILHGAAGEIISAYARELGGIRPDSFIKSRPDGPYLIVQFARPSEHQYRIHNSIISSLSDENPFKERSTVQRRTTAPTNRLTMPEAQLLRNEIAESLTIDVHSFEKNFFLRYTPSVAGFENQISANANYAVYGRRGAGKSSLLAYAMHKAIQTDAPISWVAMQTYAKRLDRSVVPAVVSEILYKLNEKLIDREIGKLVSEFDKLSESKAEDVLNDCDRLVQKTRRLIGRIATASKPLTIFLDDIHLIDQSIQPTVLGFIYKITRGNNAYIKISGIGQLTRLWDGRQMGLSSPSMTHRY